MATERWRFAFVEDHGLATAGDAPYSLLESVGFGRIDSHAQARHHRMTFSPLRTGQPHRSHEAVQVHDADETAGFRTPARGLADAPAHEQCVASSSGELHQ